MTARKLTALALRPLVEAAESSDPAIAVAAQSKLAALAKDRENFADEDAWAFVENLLSSLPDPDGLKTLPAGGLGDDGGMSRPVLVVTDDPSPEDVDAVLAARVKYNDAAGGPPGGRKLAILARDPDTGETDVGRIGRIAYDWLFVQFLVAPEAHRRQGVGSEMMARAEAFAVEHGCVGVWLDTFEFQARGFYEKLGYSLAGQIDDHPRGKARYFLQKRLG